MYLRANAKINLSLDVIGKRPDGYHEVRMIMQSVSMYDRIYLDRLINRPGITAWTNLSYIPRDEHNLAVRAAKLLMDEFSVSDGLGIRLEKFIPVSAGLAGGSSDAAMTMIGVNRMFHLGLSREELMKRAGKIGADVPYCIMGGTALSEGIGEILTPLPDMPAAYILLCKPGVSVSTRDVYGNLHLDESTVHPDVDAMIRALEASDLAGITNPASMRNVLEDVTAARYPVIREIEEKMLEGGAMHSVMSGSGPTVFGIFKEQKKAEALRDHLRQTLPGARVFLTWPTGNRPEGR